MAYSFKFNFYFCLPLLVVPIFPYQHVGGVRNVSLESELNNLEFKPGLRPH